MIYAGITIIRWVITNLNVMDLEQIVGLVITNLNVMDPEHARLSLLR